MPRRLPRRYIVCEPCYHWCVNDNCIADTYDGCRCAACVGCDGETSYGERCLCKDC